MKTTLNKLKLNSFAVIELIQTDRLTKERLESLGFLPGVRVFAVARTPFGSSSVYRCLNSMIALREEVASKIEINSIKNHE